MKKLLRILFLSLGLLFGGSVFQDSEEFANETESEEVVSPWNDEQPDRYGD